MDRFICIHGHFYQPPRENSWLEAIELQDSAYPYHDWNERITAECYQSNAASRILDGVQRIVKIVNNYTRISFNYGPTLLAWMEARRPELYDAIRQADRESQEVFGGHGSAVAQAYNHIILPLANSRDKRTQILWGLRDFEYRFGRMPEGMWLAETAVDVESLELLAEVGIKFTILAPHQAARIRKLGTRKWTDVVGGHIDPTMAYEAILPSGRKIALFFYDGPISRGIAFERLLTRGEDFAHRLLGAFSDQRTWPQLVHIATDGETYGHHHPYGDMALAYALDYIQSKGMAKLTIYGEYLERHPPTQQVEILENTAWSCAHGIERWNSDCGCNSGGHPGWNQAWRKPLRAAFDWLRDTLAPLYVEHASKLLGDPWAARDDYISVVLDRSPKNADHFFRRNSFRTLTPEERIRAIKLLELQRHAMLMYTSCGWFFDEISGIETVQVIQYAARAVQLAEDLFGIKVEEHFLNLLAEAKSNIPDHGDARRIYEKWVKPSRVDLAKVAAHFAASSLFEPYEEETNIYCYRVRREDYRHLDSGRTKLIMGRAEISSNVTNESARLCFACLHFGDHNLLGGVRTSDGDDSYNDLVRGLSEAFRRADFPECILRLDRNFSGTSFTLRTLFRDEQRKILDTILGSTLAGAEGVYRQLYEQHAPLMRFLSELAVPMPTAFKTAAEFILNTDLKRAFTDVEPDPSRIQSLLSEAETWKVQLDTAGLKYTLEQVVEGVAAGLRVHPDETSHLVWLETIADLVKLLPFRVDVSLAQNTFYELLHSVYPDFRDAAARGQSKPKQWMDRFQSLGSKLSIRVEE